MTDVAGFVAGRMVEITIDGQTMAAREGEPLAAVFLRLDDMHTRRAFASGEPRAPYCMMGVCFECVVHLHGFGATRSCQKTVQDGMNIRRQDSFGGLA